jgi:hypothetical protein
MARPEFNDFTNGSNVPLTVPGPSDPMIVERFAHKSIQVHGYVSGTFKVQATVGDHDDWEDVTGMTAIAANGFFETDLTLYKMQVVIVSAPGGSDAMPTFTFGGFDQRTDGA